VVVLLLLLCHVFCGGPAAAAVSRFLWWHTWGKLGAYLGHTWGILGAYLGHTWGILGAYLGNYRFSRISSLQGNSPPLEIGTDRLSRICLPAACPPAACCCLPAACLPAAACANTANTARYSTCSTSFPSSAACLGTPWGYLLSNILNF